jgi:competence protein ComGC
VVRIVLQRKGFLLVEAMVGVTIIVGVVTILLTVVEMVQQQDRQNEVRIAKIKQKYYQEQQAWLKGEVLP